MTAPGRTAHLALIARADSGGVATQTYEIARHLLPDRILVVKIDPPRGTFDASRYDDLTGELRVAGHHPTRADLAFLTVCDHVLTVEGFYNDGILEQKHAQLSVHANPELFGRQLREAAQQQRVRVLAPTDWALDRLPNPQLLRMPVATDRLHGPLRKGPPQSFLHVSAPAMLDRNGTDLLYAAARVYRGPRITMHVSGPRRPRRRERHGNMVLLPADDVENYWDRYTPDVLVLPRRYGGLSLVMQEAHAAGMPVVCLDRAPENTWPGTIRVPVSSVMEHHMKGGMFPVADADPHTLARTIGEIAGQDLFPLSWAALEHAESLSWGRLLPAWREAFAHRR